MLKLRYQKIQLFMFILDHLGSSWVILDHQHQHSSKMTLRWRKIDPHQTRFNLFWRPSWTLKRVKNEVKIHNRKPRILCKLHTNRHLGHGRGAILRTIYIDLDPSCLDDPRIIKIRRIKIDINGPEDSSRRQL